MSGSQISTSVSILNSLLGFQAISLSNMTTSAATAIKAGSKCEVASAFFTWGSDETPNATSWTAITSGTAYITLTPAGTAGSQTVTAAWAITAPVWSDSKQGWYASAASSIRIIGGCYKGGAAEYNNKFVLDNKELTSFVSLNKNTAGAYGIETLQTLTIEIGDWDMDATASTILTHNISDPSVIRGVRVIIRNDLGNNYDLNRYSAAGVVGGGVGLIDSAQITLLRLGGGEFDSNFFDSTSYNRGWVTITYAS